MMRRFLGERSPLKSDFSSRRPLPNLSDDDGSILDCDKVCAEEEAMTIGKRRDSSVHSRADSTASTAESSLAEASPDSITFIKKKDLQVAYAEHAIASKQASGGTNPFRIGAGVAIDSDEDGQGLGLGAATKATSFAACCAASEDTVVIDVRQSALWSAHGQEEVLKVEISTAESVIGLRRRIADLYGLPVDAQRLQSTPDLGGTRIQDAVRIEDLAHQPVFLLPADLDVGDQETVDSDVSRRRLEMRAGRSRSDRKAEAEAEERVATARIVMESLKGVTYNLDVISAGAGVSDTSSRTMTFEATALVSDVHVALQMDVIRCPSMVPMILVFNGKPVPPETPLHFAGVRDGDTLVVFVGRAHEAWQDVALDEDSEDDDDDPVLRWAACH